MARQVLIQLFRFPHAVQYEGPSGFQPFQNIVFFDVGLVVAGYEVRFVDEVSGLDGVLTESQVRYGQTAGFFGVIGEVALCIQVRIVADDLNGALVGTDGTVGTQTPELTPGNAFLNHFEGFRAIQ